MMRSRLLPAVLVVLAVFGLSACNTSLATPADTTPNPTSSAGTAGQDLDALTVAPDHDSGGYNRDRDFGSGWATQPDHCDTRVDVLQAQGTGVVVSHAGGRCKVTAGTWVSLYDNLTVTDPGGLDVDHLVPLKEAWDTGAADWTTAQRKAFANDIAGGELIAVDAHTNRSKGDDPPPGYEPPDPHADCVYAQRWVAVKDRYRLTITAPEHAALATMLATCPQETHP